MTRAIQPTTACADCGTTGGYRPPRNSRPQRSSGATYGFSGTLCKSCTEKHRYNLARGIVAGEPVERTVTVEAVPLCADCGTEGGYIPASMTRPVRGDGTRYGFNGVVCKRCGDRHAHRLRREQMIAGTVKSKRVFRLPKPPKDPLAALASLPDKLTPSSACVLILNRTRKVFRERRVGA